MPTIKQVYTDSRDQDDEKDATVEEDEEVQKQKQRKKEREKEVRMIIDHTAQPKTKHPSPFSHTAQARL